MIRGFFKLRARETAFVAGYVFLYAVGANAPAWFASRSLGLLLHGWLCPEYALIGALALFVPRAISVVLLATVMLLDALLMIDLTFYIFPARAISSAGALLDLPPLRMAWVAANLLVMAGILALAWFAPRAVGRGRGRLATAASLILVAAFYVSAEAGRRALCVLANHNQMSWSQVLHPDDLDDGQSVHWVRFPVKAFAQTAGFERNTKTMAAAMSGLRVSVPSAAAVAISSRAMRNSEGAIHPDLVLVLVESWGLAGDSVLRQALAAPYQQPDVQAKYQVLSGQVPFYGPTVAGEARELCGSRIGFHLLDASSQEVRNCLPERLDSLGYHTMAVHGMYGHVFQRETWYPRIGFQEQWFQDRLAASHLPDCPGAFRGICDAAIADWIGSRLQEPTAAPRFVYWVTLNAHLPVPTPASVENPASCSVTRALINSPALCAWYQLEVNVHRSVGRLSMRRLARPTVFVIVGDHAPPFGKGPLRANFSAADVPYIVLLPRTEGQQRPDDRLDLASSQSANPRQGPGAGRDRLRRTYANGALSVSLVPAGREAQ